MKTCFERGGTGWQARCAGIESDSISAFLTYCKGNGYSVRESSRNQDMRQHIDYTVSANGESYTVDIKGRKRFSDMGLFLIELVNVSGNRGWLFGKADLIAFQTENGFLIVRRNDLYNLVRQKLGLMVLTKGNFRVISSLGKKTANLPAVAPEWYAREDRPREMITYLTEAEISSIAYTSI